MGNHYVPKVYLRGFSTQEDDRYIFMYRKHTDHPVRTNLRNVAQQTDLYPQELETQFANSLETPTKPILHRILSHQQLTDLERSSFVVFIVATYRRVPIHLDMVSKIFHSETDTSYDRWENEIKELLVTRPDKEAILQRRLEELRTIRREKRITPERIWHQLLSSHPLQMVSWAVENMSWQFLFADEDAFLASDNPVFFFSELGLGRMNSELTFPISSKIALLATWQSSVRQVFRRAQDKEIVEINRRTASAAMECVFFSRDVSWIPNLLKKSSRKLHQLVKDPSDNRLVRTPW